MLITMILAAGDAKRFVGYQTPKQFLEIQRCQMWEQAVESLTERTEVYLVMQEKHRKYLRKTYRIAHEIMLRAPTKGQADTLKQGLQYLANLRNGVDDEILVVNCDLGFAPGLLNRLVHWGRDYECPTALTFPASVDEQSRWSYVNSHPQFTHAAEKIAIGSHALAGAYYFPHRIYLHDAIDETVDWVLGTGHEPYLSSVYEFLLSPKVSVECRREDLYDWGTPEAYERWNEVNK